MDPELTPVAELLIALAAAIIVYVQNRQKNQARAETVEAQNQTAQVVSFFDPQGTVSIPPAEVPARSWKMSDETKRWITFDHNPEEQQSLLRQIAEAEAAQRTSYILDVPSHWYLIEFGLIRSSGEKMDKSGATL